MDYVLSVLTAINKGSQILQTELEASLQTAEERLAGTSAELEKQKILNEKLENDLLSMNSHKSNGDLTASNNDSTDVLAGLDLGRKPVRLRLCFRSRLIVYLW